MSGAWVRETPGSGRRRLGAVAVTVALALLGCGGHRGAGQERDDAWMSDAARNTDPATDAAERLNQSLGHRDRIRDAASIAATEVVTDVATPPPGADPAVRQEALAWSGRVYADELATIDVRFVSLGEGPTARPGESSQPAGRTTRCYRYELRLYRYTTYREIDCPPGAAPPPPSAAPVPALPADGRKRLTTVLRAATPATLAGAVRAAFPQEWITVDTVTHEGALVAAVGVPPERQCLLLVRTPAGKIEEPGYDRIWLEPGETGCKTGLYVAPPR
ncbi:hypothetical protein [Micromonospora sp. WMMD975]|uniref:hypothetical protein n=1 Tax=Micromonospora sp. WMMD975 TaxID=3016087 RepID=UPI00249A7984|nr:hypothetical protein [Micromonospora sp. WMMD975]WFE36173.1 hypothetical protein O7613_12550 [Micromonospora sp. WMMD975]